MTTLLDQYKEELAATRRKLAKPLSDRLKELNESIGAKQAQLVVERAERTGIVAELRKIDPELAPALYKKNGTNGKKTTKKKTRKGLGPEKMSELTLWLQAHKAELNANGGFRSVDVRDDLPFAISEATLHKTLMTLHDRGVLILDRWVKGRDFPHRRTGKFYKVA